MSASKSNKSRPNLSRFHQQQLPACTPVITVRNAFPFCLIIGVIFVSLGAWFLTISRNLQEHVIPYTHCKEVGSNVKCSEKIRSQTTSFATCNCQIQLNVTHDMTGPVYVYYGLTNFYQNHRRYVRSRDDEQLNGQQQDNPSNDCEPYKFQNVSGSQVAIAPCGAVAASIFNDTFTILGQPWNRTNIAWRSDREVKFGKVTTSSLSKTVKPASWPKGPLERNPNSYSGDEDLIVWMRTAALPTFRKLYAHINDGLKKGSYIIDMTYAYPVTQFDGTKKVIITESSWLGGKNDAMGIAYIVVGLVHILLGGVFLIIDLHLIRRKSRSR